jgi:hypothetical protein
MICGNTMEDKEKWTTEEIFCRQSVIPVNMKYIYTNIYKCIDDEKSAIVVGSIVVSDQNSDHCILQFFEDDDVTDFFINEIVLPTESGSLTEGWLVGKSFWRDKSDLFFFSLPMASPGRSAKTLCENLYKLWDNQGYLFDASRETELLEI